MHYFQVLLRLLQTPSILDVGSETALTDSFGYNVREIIAHSKTSFETLLRAYYLRHSFEWLDSYLVSLLMEVCLMTIGDINARHDENLLALQSTVILLAKGIFEQGQSMFLGQLVFQLVRERMRMEDLEALQRFIVIEPLQETQSTALRLIQMEWPVEITSMEDNPESKRLGDLVQKLSETSLEPSGSEASTS